MKETKLDIHHTLIESAKKGDSGAQYELYSLYAKAMLNASFRIVNDRDEAEDILQESFVRVFKNIGQFRGESTFGAWVKRIVVNASLNALKKRKLDLVDIEETVEPQEVDYDDEELLSIENIKRAMMKLPDGFRAVFSLYALEGYDHKEIGEILNISESTSKSQYNRAKKKMQGFLKEMYDYER